VSTLTITSASVGYTVAQNGTLSALRFLVADRGMYRVFTLVDDAPPYISPKQIFNSAMLGFATNQNGALASPFVIFEGQSIAFGNLTVLACPQDSKFEVDTTGALAAPIPAEPNWRHTVFGERLAADAERRRDEQIVAAERARTWTPPLPPPAIEQPPFAPPDAFEAAALRDAREAVAAEAEMRAKASGPTLRGLSLAERELEALIFARTRRAERRASEAHIAEFEAKAAERRRMETERQMQATALLKGQ
jgi:hypothetical protein